MCRVHTAEELANILDTMADLFAWKRRETLVQAARGARFPSQPWRYPALSPDMADQAESAPDYAPGMGRPRSA